VKVAFSSRSWEEFLHWRKQNSKLFDRLLALIEDVRRSPFRGIGKPEPLRED
jgi:toxin YoeB